MADLALPRGPLTQHLRAIRVLHNEALTASVGYYGAGLAGVEHRQGVMEHHIQTIAAYTADRPRQAGPAQCGRTRVHAAHETTEGRCAGLDGTEVTDEVDYEGTVERLRAGLGVIAARGCETDTTGCDLSYRTADARSSANRICPPCIARLVLDAEPIPGEADRG